MDKKTNRWLDVQVVIASLAIVASLALWNLFASASRKVVNPVTIGGQASSGNPVLASQPGTRILLGGTAPHAPAFRQPGPAPVTVTSSSRP